MRYGIDSYVSIRGNQSYLNTSHDTESCLGVAYVIKRRDNSDVFAQETNSIRNRVNTQPSE